MKIMSYRINCDDGVKTRTLLMERHVTAVCPSHWERLEEVFSNLTHMST